MSKADSCLLMVAYIGPNAARFKLARIQEGRPGKTARPPCLRDTG
jgi:hypothetical protein